MKIHIGWLGSEPPGRVTDAVAAARKLCPACEVMLHTDESLVPAARRATMDSRGLTVRQRSDIQRHAILEAHGGLWLDADVRLLKSPTEWAAAFDRYTAMFLTRPGGIIGTDIIYVPAGWAGWPLVNARIDAILADASRRIGILDLAHVMLAGLSRQQPEAFSFLPPGGQFPFRPGDYTTDAVVARGFDPAGLTPRPGLGDMIASGLSAIGITKARAQAVANAVGIKDCGCGKRQAAANRLGTYLGLPPGSTAGS